MYCTTHTEDNLRVCMEGERRGTPASLKRVEEEEEEEAEKAEEEEADRKAPLGSGRLEGRCVVVGVCWAGHICG